MKTVHMIAFLVLIVGGFNWLALGLFGWELGNLLGGQEAVASRILYIIVGLAAVYELVAHKSGCRICSSDGGKMKGSHGNESGGMTQ